MAGEHGFALASLAMIFNVFRVFQSRRKHRFLERMRLLCQKMRKSATLI